MNANTRRLHRRWAPALLATLVLLVGAACGARGASSSSDVIATTSIVGALTKAVAGDTFEVGVIVGPGVDPHDYEASPDDATRIAGAKVVFRNGIGMDTFLDRVIAGSGQATVVTVTDEVKLRQGEAEDGKLEDDPHVWHDPANAKIMVDNIATALSSAYPDRASTFGTNATAYKAKLDGVDAEIKTLIEAIPPANRKVVTNHDALGYFLERYGLTYIGAVIPSVSTAGEPSARDIAALQATIRAEGVKAIFAESSVDPKIAREIAKDTGIRIVDDLYGDSLGKPGSEADTVDKMLLVNARKIANALK